MVKHWYFQGQWKAHMDQQEIGGYQQCVILHRYHHIHQMNKKILSLSSKTQVLGGLIQVPQILVSKSYKSAEKCSKCQIFNFSHFPIIDIGNLVSEKLELIHI